MNARSRAIGSSRNCHTDERKEQHRVVMLHI
jgi:hypothetical protein